MAAEAETAEPVILWLGRRDVPESPFRDVIAGSGPVVPAAAV